MIKTKYVLEDSVVNKIVDGLKTGNYDVVAVQRDADHNTHCITETTTADIIVQGFRVQIIGEKIKPRSSY